MHENLYALEKTLLDPKIRQNLTKLNTLLSPDFFEFGSSGIVWSRENILERLPKETPKNIAISDFKSFVLSDKVILVTYKAIKTCDNGDTYETLRSSIWKLSGSQWQMAFHQGTKV
jgi:hypothetical protein